MKTLSQSQGDGTPTGRPVEVDRTPQTEKRRPVATGKLLNTGCNSGLLDYLLYHW